MDHRITKTIAGLAVITFVGAEAAHLLHHEIAKQDHIESEVYSAPEKPAFTMVASGGGGATITPGSGSLTFTGYSPLTR